MFLNIIDVFLFIISRNDSCDCFLASATFLLIYSIVNSDSSVSIRIFLSGILSIVSALNFSPIEIYMLSFLMILLSTFIFERNP